MAAQRQRRRHPSRRVSPSSCGTDGREDACASCAARVQRAGGNLAGFDDAAENFSTGRLDVRHDADVIVMGAVEAAVTQSRVRAEAGWLTVCGCGGPAADDRRPTRTVTCPRQQARIPTTST